MTAGLDEAETRRVASRAACRVGPVGCYSQGLAECTDDELRAILLSSLGETIMLNVPAFADSRMQRNIRVDTDFARDSCCQLANILTLCTALELILPCNRVGAFLIMVKTRDPQ